MVPKPSIGWLAIHDFKLVMQTPPVNQSAPKPSAGLGFHVLFHPF